MQGNLELCKPMLVIIHPSSSFQWCSGKCWKVFTSAGSFLDSWWFLCGLYYNCFRQQCVLMYSWEEVYTIGPYTPVTTLTKRTLLKKYIHILGSAVVLSVFGDARDGRSYTERRPEAARLAVHNTPSLPRQEIHYLWCNTWIVNSATTLNYFSTFLAYFNPW